MCNKLFLLSWDSDGRTWQITCYVDEIEISEYDSMES